MKTARFGPAGTADSFAALGYKKTVQLPDYLEANSLMKQGEYGRI